jgi:hypothetical protein
MVRGGVRAGVTPPQQPRDGFPGATIAVIGERRQRVEPKGLLPGFGRVLFLVNG